MPDEILVVFTDRTDVWWLKFLRRGFRHCFICIRFANQWIAVEPMLHRVEITRLDLPDSVNLQRWFEDEGDISVSLHPLDAPEAKPLTPAFITCVELVKRVLGLRRAFILTPYQLYTHLLTLTERDISNGKPNLST